jgi:Protein kinase domain
MEPLAGDDPVQVAGYRLRARLGAGGMGRVYLAFTAGGRPVAIKVIRPELGDDRDFRDRFRQEVDAARRVNGLYTAQVLDADPAGSPPWLVTAYVPGPSLQQAVSEHGPLPVDTVLLLMAGVAEALEAIHAAGVVHRDLKPSNVLLAADGPRVIDFGIARAIEATTVTRTGMRVGSPPFMAPEQVQGLPVSPATDVFALGSLVGYAATGRLPFGAGNEHAMLYRVVQQEPDLDGCPEPLRALIGRCLAKDPAERPAPAEVIAQCRSHTAGQTLRIAQSWLPASVSADLAEHAPAFPPTVTSGPGLPGPDARPGPGATIPPGGAGGAPYGRPATPVPPAAPGGTWTAGSRGRIGRTPVLAGVAVLAAAGIGAAVAVLLSSGGTSSGAGSNASAGGAGTSPSAAASRVAVVGPPTPTATPAPTTPSPAACVTGTWKAVDQQVVNTINGQQIVFTGGGGVSTFQPNGQYSTAYDNVVYSAEVNGVEWTEVLQGAVTGHWAIENGNILYSSLTSSGTDVLDDNGAYNNSGPLQGLPGAVPFQCSGDTLRESFPTGGSDQLTRLSS